MLIAVVCARLNLNGGEVHTTRFPFAFSGKEPSKEEEEDAARFALGMLGFHEKDKDLEGARMEMYIVAVEVGNGGRGMENPREGNPWMN